MEGGGGGGGGGFGYGNLQNNPPLYKPCPPLSAIDRFLWGQNHLSHQNSCVQVKNKETLGCLANGFADFSSSSGGGGGGGAIASYGSIGFSWPTSTRNDHHIMSLVESGPFLDEETCSWLHERNLNPNLSLNDEARIAEKNSKRAGKKKVKVGYSSTLIKGQWTEEEDRKLIRLVKQYGERKWAQIADKLVGRAGKQCRERWHNHLRPDIKKDGWSEEEERMLIEAHQMVGNKWAEIAKRIPGRTENSIKNHFNATKRRQNSRRKNKQQQDKKEGAKSQTSILQDYIKSNNPIIDTTTNIPPTTNSTNPTDHSSTISDDPMNQQYFNSSQQPEQSESATTDDPLTIPHTYDDELLFIQNILSSNNNNNHHINLNLNQQLVDTTTYNQLIKNSSVSFNNYSYDDQTNTGGGDHQSSLPPTSNNMAIYRNTIQGEEAAVHHHHQSGHLYSDMYLSYLLNGGCNTTTTATTYSSSCSNNDWYYNDDYKSLEFVSDDHDQDGTTTYLDGRKEMDLIEMVSFSQFSQGSSTSNCNF